MLFNIYLHQGGHGEGHECCHKHHCHGEHKCQQPGLSPEQTLTLLSYMLDHNKSHAEELVQVCSALSEQGKEEAGVCVKEAIHYFEHGVEKLAEAIKSAKGE